MPYRGLPLTCLTCRVAMHDGDLEGAGYAHCAGCGSVWIGVRVLDALLRKLGAQKPLELRERKGERVRPCLECSALMAPALLPVAVPVDWCDAHGVWFDTSEFGVTLAAAYIDEKEWRRQFGKLAKTFT